MRHRGGGSLRPQERKLQMGPASELCQAAAKDPLVVGDEEHNWFCKPLSGHPGAAGSRKHIRALEAVCVSRSCDKELRQRLLSWALAFLAGKSGDTPALIRSAVRGYQGETTPTVYSLGLKHSVI